VVAHPLGDGGAGIGHRESGDQRKHRYAGECEQRTRHTASRGGSALLCERLLHDRPCALLGNHAAVVARALEQAL
jgi:hypothetical protein